MTSDSQTSAKGRQHDDHCAAKEIANIMDRRHANTKATINLDEWVDWEPTPPEVKRSVAEAFLEGKIAMPEPDYVICKSNEVEHLYWGAGKWGALAKATRYTHDTVLATREPKDGFWTTLDRAKELEE